MPQCVETSHGSQQRLSGTDVRSSFFAFDVLLACLQCHTVTNMSILVFRQSDDTSRHITLVLIASSEVSSRRTSVEHRSSQSLSATEYYVGTPFSGRNQKRKTQDVGTNSHLTSGFVSLGYKCAIVFYRTAVVRILNDATENFGSKFKVGIIASHHLNTLRNGSGADNRQVLREYFFIYEKGSGTCLLLCTATQAKHHGSGFGSGGSFVKQRTVCQRHGGKIRNYSLEIKQRLKSSL